MGARRKAYKVVVACWRCIWKGRRALHAGWANECGKTFDPCPRCGGQVKMVPDAH
jgi:hypothetical protein